jgi:hypothetical protein
LPNTFYAKVYQGPGPISLVSLLDILEFVQMYGLFFLLIGLTFLIALRGAGSEHSGSRQNPHAAQAAARILYAACLAFLLLVTVQYLRSNLVQNLAHRFFVPHFVIGLIGFGVLLERIMTALPASRANLSQRLAYGIICLLVIGQLLLFTGSYWPTNSYFEAYRRLLADEHIPIGTFLRNHIPANEWLIVVEDAGAIPYLSLLKTVDFGKLNDRYLASDSHTASELADYFFSFNAGVLVFNSSVWDRVVYSPVTDFILDDPRFGSYRRAMKTRSDAWPGYFEFVYLRNDLVTQ